MRVALAALLMATAPLLTATAERTRAQAVTGHQPLHHEPLYKADLLPGPPGTGQNPYRPYQRQPPGGTLPLKAPDVLLSLKARGFSDVAAIRQRGGNFLCEATGPRGERVRLVIDAATAEITGMQVIGYDARD